MRRAAFDLKEILDALELQSFVKASGGKGLHVHIPIDPHYDEDTVKNFARSLAAAMVKRHPARYTTNLAKSSRKGKIFVDYLRNGPSSTAVSPYSVRARAGAPVAMPLSWKEASRLESAAAFSISRALAYLKKRAADPWAGYLELRQKLPGTA